MEKILVTTDFSDHSKSGLRFAIQLAAQNDYLLTFLNVHHLQIPSAWDVLSENEYQDEQKRIVHAKLIQFVENIYEAIHLKPKHVQYAVELSPLPESSVLEFAENHNFNYICISARGAGILNKILGTITSNLINQSKVPVIVVPHDYQATEISSILYASDLEDYENEIGKVVAFAKPLQASIELLNFTSLELNQEEVKKLETKIQKTTDYPLTLHVGERKQDHNLIESIRLAVKKAKPSILVMFTQQNRNWFENIFYAGNAAEYSFHTKVPLVVFRKS